MSINSIKRSVVKVVSIYKDRLDAISEEDFIKTPSQGGWSYSELYSHIIQVNKLSLISMERCINGTAKRVDRRTHWIVWLIMQLGKLPPGRIKAPERIASMVSQITKEEAKNQLTSFFERFDEICHEVTKAMPDCKVSHPRLGPLNARQWLRFIDIHSRHHIAQLRRIERGVSG
jgi:hypothetical protein